MAGDRPSAVRIFAPEHPALARTLRAKLEKQQLDLAGHVAGGLAQDWADYKHRVGVIKGLDDAIEACKQTEQDLNGE